MILIVEDILGKNGFSKNARVQKENEKWKQFVLQIAKVIDNARFFLQRLSVGGKYFCLARNFPGVVFLVHLI